MTTLINSTTIKVLRVNVFDFFWKEFLLLNSQTDKPLTNIVCDMLTRINVSLVTFTLQETVLTLLQNKR